MTRKEAIGRRAQLLGLSAAVGLLATGCPRNDSVGDQYFDASAPGLDASAPGLDAGVVDSGVTVFAADSSPYGKTYADWVAAWNVWQLSIPKAENPMYDLTGADCAQSQNGPVWFLAAPLKAASPTWACTVPAGKALFVPITVYADPYPCPDPNFKPAAGQSLADFLTQDMASAIAQWLPPHSVDLDGVSLEGFRVNSGLFDLTIESTLTGACFTHTSQQAVSDGYFLILPPLSPGQHTLYSKQTTATTSIEMTFNLTIQ